MIKNNTKVNVNVVVRVRAVSSKDLKIEKEKQGITRAEELRAETVP